NPGGFEARAAVGVHASQKRTFVTGTPPCTRPSPRAVRAPSRRGGRPRVLEGFAQVANHPRGARRGVGPRLPSSPPQKTRGAAALTPSRDFPRRRWRAPRTLKPCGGLLRPLHRKVYEPSRTLRQLLGEPLAPARPRPCRRRSHRLGATAPASRPA